jgi:hypothetical protein
MSEQTLTTSKEKMMAFVSKEEPRVLLLMLNLLRFREWALYPDDFEGSRAETGREAYALYGKLLMPALLKVGASLKAQYDIGTTLIAPDGEVWDQALIVEYPIRAAFTEAVANPAYKSVGVHLEAALLDSRLIEMFEGGEGII